jgi:pimeloyl-ACP methyl ester carboxylesterase
VTRPRPFDVHVPDSTLADLRTRLEQTRWPADTSADLRRLVERWRDEFDWRAREAAINQFANYTVDLDRTRVHFVHERADGDARCALILTHGWPSSFLEYLPLVPLLTASGFDVVVPSLPGYAFSEPLPPGRFDRVPELWVRLMSDVLGYERFGAYGGDIGGMVTNRLAHEYPERLVGIHVSFLAEPHVAGPLSAAERAFLDARPQGLEDAGAYAHVQRTRPKTLAVALEDSPAGLAAWICDKWCEWSERVDEDALLATLTLYWATRSVSSSFRPYAEWKLAGASPAGLELEPGERIEVPTAVALFSLARWPREWADRAYSDLRRWTEMARGGHFGALEAPELLADELRAFFGSLR